MHEIAIADSILKAVRGEMTRYASARPTRVIVRIGELTAIDPDALRFGFEALTHDTDYAGLQLEIECCPRRHRCIDCGAEFTVTGFDFHCPQCGGEKNEFVSGDQLELASLEMDQDESSAA